MTIESIFIQLFFFHYFIFCQKACHAHNRRFDLQTDKVMSIFFSFGIFKELHSELNSDILTVKLSSLCR